MSLYRDFDESHLFSDYPFDENNEELSHRKHIRKMLEDQLERKRLKEEIDELDGEFDWDEISR